MTKYFMQQTQLAGLEADMMLAPFFTRRYRGVIILSRFQYDTENTKCKYCTAYLKGKGCTEKKCPWLAERLEAGAVPYDGQLGTNDLEAIYERCNNDHPPGYAGHSLSISDVVELYDANGSEFHYCDCFGFKPIDFVPSNQTEDVEMTMTQSF